MIFALITLQNAFCFQALGTKKSGSLTKEHINNRGYNKFLKLTGSLLIYAKVIGNLSPPWKFRSMDARPQQFWRTLQPTHWRSQQISEVFGIFGNAISYRALQMIPNPFIRIQLRSITRKFKGTDVRPMLSEPLFDRSSLVRHATIPDQDEAFRQMPVEMLQELKDLRPTDIFVRMKSDIKTDPSGFNRDADSRNRGNLRPTPSTRQDRSVATWSPRPPNGRNQQKATLVKKHRRDTTPLSVFLYAAIDNVSSALWPLDFSVWLFSRAFDNSIPSPLKAAKYDWDGRRFPNAALLPRRFSGWSTDRLNNHSSRPLAKEFVPTYSFAFCLTSMAFQKLLWSLNLLRPVFGEFLSTSTVNSKNNLFSWQPPADLIFSAARWPAGDVPRVAFGFHMVSWNHHSSLISKFLLLLRKSIIWRPFRGWCSEA